MGTFNSSVDCWLSERHKQMSKAKVFKQHSVSPNISLVCLNTSFGPIIFLLFCNKSMKRTSPWNKFHKTFADCSTSTPVKKTKPNRSRVEVQVKDDHDYHIEDSDEENQVQNESNARPIKGTKSITASRATFKQRQQRSIKPLMISILNASTNVTTIVTSEDSNDCVEDDDRNLVDVSHKETTSYRHRSRFNTSCLNISTGKISSNYPKHDSKCNAAEKHWNNSMKEQLSTFQNVFNGHAHDLPKGSEVIISDSEATESDTDDKSSTNFTISADKSDKNTQSVQIDTESTQNSLKLATQISLTLTKTATKTKKFIKNGLADQLHKAANKSKSDHSFWVNDRLASLTEAGEQLKIDKIEPTYGRILLHCINTSNVKKIICLDTENRKFSTLRIGRTIEVFFDTPGYKLEQNLIFYPYVNKILS